jgi:hypothetical protein
MIPASLDPEQALNDNTMVATKKAADLMRSMMPVGASRCQPPSRW